jgi:hypothetical protein
MPQAGTPGSGERSNSSPGSATNDHWQLDPVVTDGGRINQGSADSDHHELDPRDTNRDKPAASNLPKSQSPQ